MNEITFENVYKDHTILPYKYSGDEKFIEILDRQHRYTEYMLSRHCKVIQTRFDLHYPQDCSIVPSNTHIHNFNENIMRYLNSHRLNGHCYDAVHMWVREQHDSNFPHYHQIVWVNANASRNPYFIFQLATHYWSKVLRIDATNLVHHCMTHTNGIIIDRNKDNCNANLNDAFRAGSYLAKTKSKSTREKGAWLCGGSRLPKIEM